MTFDFDKIIERRGSDSYKWWVCSGRDVLPMWIADMDFASPPCVLEALRRRVDHEVFGYAVAREQLAEAVCVWAGSHYGWRIAPEWLVWLPGLVPGIHVACLACADNGDEVVAFTPVYPPFLSAPATTGRALKTVPLKCAGNRWTMDLGALAQSLTPRTKLLLLCHPHNPVGRAFERGELDALRELCLRRNLIVCSDEIHCDLALDPCPHVPFASLDTEIAARTVTLMSPAKTFNTPGLNCGFAVIPDKDLRRKFEHAMRGMVPHPNVLGLAAAQAAYAEGEPWRRELIAYLRGNRDLLAEFISKELPQFKLPHVEATYLAWLDTRTLGERNTPEFFERAGVKLSDGAPFGGPGFMRLNFACPRAVLRHALERIRAAVSGGGGGSGTNSAIEL